MVVTIKKRNTPQRLSDFNPTAGMFFLNSANQQDIVFITNKQLGVFIAGTRRGEMQAIDSFMALYIPCDVTAVALEV